MFAKHSFGVKYPSEIPAGSPTRLSEPVGADRPISDVTPREQNQIMTAAIEVSSRRFVPVGPAHGGSTVSSVGAAPRRLAPEIYRARRLAAVALAFGLVVGAVVGIVSVGGQAAASRGDQADVTDSVLITVMPGDTLWGIARGLAPDTDPRALVHQLSAIAGKGPLQPGQQLVVPHSVIG